MFYFLKQVYEGENNLWKFQPSSSSRNARVSERKMELLQPAKLDLLRHTHILIHVALWRSKSSITGCSTTIFLSLALALRSELEGWNYQKLFSPSYTYFKN